MRMYAYQALFAGAHGHTYGCHDIWQFYSPYRESVNNPHVYWQEAMELPGAGQMKHVRTLMEAFPYTERVPDQSLVAENTTEQAYRIQATRGKDYAMIYSTAGRPFTVHMGKISGTTVEAFWYDPRKGTSAAPEQYPNKGSVLFTPPTAGYGQDWVLVLADAAKKYPRPGAR